MDFDFIEVGCYSMYCMTSSETLEPKLKLISHVTLNNNNNNNNINNTTSSLSFTFPKDETQYLLQTEVNNTDKTCWRSTITTNTTRDMNNTQRHNNNSYQLQQWKIRLQTLGKQSFKHFTSEVVTRCQRLEKYCNRNK